MFVAFLPTTGQVLGNAYLVTLFPVCRQCGSNPTDSFTVPENGVFAKFTRPRDAPTRTWSKADFEGRWDDYRFAGHTASGENRNRTVAFLPSAS